MTSTVGADLSVLRARAADLQAAGSEVSALAPDARAAGTAVSEGLPYTSAALDSLAAEWSGGLARAGSAMSSTALVASITATLFDRAGNQGAGG